MRLSGRPSPDSKEKKDKKEECEPEVDPFFFPTLESFAFFIVPSRTKIYIACCICKKGGKGEGEERKERKETNERKKKYSNGDTVFTRLRPWVSQSFLREH